ncbi:MAG: hypothetical protein PWP23_3009, partial [Candidatus Sumerlaeota bacterium]|nr:hypothetical protein [Candidatus Sumerlaeota bacterium]
MQSKRSGSHGQGNTQGTKRRRKRRGTGGGSGGSTPRQPLPLDAE